LTEKTTSPKSLWSETIFEILFDLLEANKPDRDILRVLAEIRDKGYKKSYVIRKVEKKLGKSTAARINSMLK